ncbi:MAG: hypothetical protein KBD64_01505 [Gammaproteobacteria bacterium]|nr:hypothetical protein [Gammaproteobacteria bacterium]
MKNDLYDHSHMCLKKQVSWTAILVGAFVAVGLGFLLNLFSVATGLSFTTTDKTGMATLAIGGFVGLLIGSIVCMYVAGFVSGYLGRHYCVKRHLGVVYGFTTWCVALIFTVLLASQMGRYVSFYSNFTSNPSAVASTTHNDKTWVMKHNAKAPAVMAAPMAAPMTSQDEAAANNMGIASYLVFALFFFGAVSCSFGGHMGMTCHCRHED